MRRVLVLGGNRWLGARIAALLVAAGDDVTCLAREPTALVPAGARLIRADRTRPDAYADASGDWDEVVELAYARDVVGSALAALRDRAAHWTLISSVSVYARNDEVGADEAAALVPPVEPDEYAQAKVAAEQASAGALGERLLIVRPGLIAGPGDPSDRFGYWPARLLHGGQVLVPVTEGRYVQIIDVDDLAAFVVHAGRHRVGGVINAVGDPVPFADLLDLIAAATGFSGRLMPATDDWLVGHDVRFWMGERSLPLWLPAAAAGFARRSNAAYRAAGGGLSPIEQTIARTLLFERELGIDRPRRSGLSPNDEAELLRLLR
ncbi:MAG: NAD-dependent epimerase/dehydratase family protein [Micropruina sp.]|nr:NAD-dependent epimerase/dehydratase family protein [Micropruina sp.]